MRPRLAGFAEQLQERVLHERVQTGGRLVENGQSWLVEQRLNEPYLLPVAAAEPPGRQVEVHAQALRERVRRPQVLHAPQAGEVAHRLPPRGPHVQAELARQVAHRPAYLHALPVGIEAENLRVTAGGVEQIEEQPDGRRLACAVRPDESEDLAWPDLQIEALDAQTAAVVLGESLCEYRRGT